MKQPTKAIICAAGLGTRFLPQTKSVPKEMLPIIDKPVIQLIVEKAVSAGVTDIIIVTREGKTVIEDHFDHNRTLENTLIKDGKIALADEIKAVADMANFIFIRQKGDLYGSAIPVLNAMNLLEKDEPFFVFFPDDYFRSDVAWPVQLKEAYNKTGKSVISLVKVDKKDADKYGMVEINSEVDGKVFKLDGLLEKPGEANAPSEYASVGSYLLMPEILPILEKKTPGKNGEIFLADAINVLAHTDTVYGCSIDGVWHDTGDKLKYLETLVDEALHDVRFSENFKKYLQKMLNNAE